MIREIIGSAICITSMATCATHIPATKEESDKIKTDGIYFNKFEMDGHRYIIFREGSLRQMSVVHDPDCNCLKNGKSWESNKAKSV